MLEVDGSQKSGSGTILRLSVALAAILNQPLHVFNIRRKRPQPGLKPQHLEAVLTATRLCRAKVRGAKLGSEELWFSPHEIVGGTIEAEIGTAGSIPILLITVLPICIVAENPVRIHIAKGGTDVTHSPTINYLSHVFLPLLHRMGLRTTLQVHQYGYYPKGMGEVSVIVHPNPQMKALHLREFGSLKTLAGVSVCTHLAKQRVAERQAQAATEALRSHGRANIQTINDFSNPLQKGSSVTLWGKTTTGAILGGDAIGERGKPSETVGKEAADNLLKELDAKATVDVHLADLLVPYMALARGESTFLVRSLTDHLETNLWLAQEILDVKFKVGRINGLVRVEKQPS